MSYTPIRSEPNANYRTNNHDSKSVLTRKPIPRSKQHERNHSANGQWDAAKLRSDWPIIVHCHLCWDWVWQRPQQFLSRLSVRHKILFVETHPPDPQLSSV